MIEQDYIMRVIKEMVRALLKLLFNIDMASPSSELLENEQKEVLDSLLDLVDEGYINEAENRIYDLDNSKASLEIALLFYSYLNDKSDEFLLEHDFSRQEIKQGITVTADKYGLGSVVDTFLII